MQVGNQVDGSSCAGARGTVSRLTTFLPPISNSFGVEIIAPYAQLSQRWHRPVWKNQYVILFSIGMDVHDILSRRRHGSLKIHDGNKYHWSRKSMKLPSMGLREDVRQLKRMFSRASAQSVSPTLTIVRQSNRWRSCRPRSWRCFLRDANVGRSKRLWCRCWPLL